MLKNKIVSAMGGAPANYIEDVFSTYLYTGNGSTQTINNGIDLAGEGGLVWAKARSVVANHTLFDTSRGVSNGIYTNTTGSQTGVISGYGVTSFNSDGFSLGGTASGDVNTNAATHVAWTFRKQPKFFDVVTYTGTGSVQAIPHNLGSVPGFYVVKRTDSTSGWSCYHRSLNGGVNPEDYVIALNSTAASASAPNEFDTAPTSTHFYVGSSIYTNASGGTYVAYLFAHDAGGFGDDGEQNVVSCGSFTTSNFKASINLGFEPQFILLKGSNPGGTGWHVFDSMRGMTAVGVSDAYLLADASGAEISTQRVSPNATGFDLDSSPDGQIATYIYIAIRRGPMKTPTSGTSVFAPVAQSTTGSSIIPAGFPVDLSLIRVRDSSTFTRVFDRLRGKNNYLRTSATTAETVDASTIYTDDYNTGVYENIFLDGFNGIYHFFRRAPGFFDEVCYTGIYNSGNPRNITHNLGVTPELIIVKCRSTASTNWVSCTKNGSTNSVMRVNSTAASSTVNGPGFPSVVNSTSTTFQVREWTNMDDVNATGRTYVAYLFASCPGVSKVGSYTGTGTTQQINCGFTSGARFIMVKSTSTTGDWIVVDTARGLVSGNDPTLALNSTAAEVTTNDWFDPYSAGFELSNVSGNLANTNGTSYIYLAIA